MLFPTPTATVRIPLFLKNENYKNSPILQILIVATSIQATSNTTPSKDLRTLKLEFFCSVLAQKVLTKDPLHQIWTFYNRPHAPEINFA